MTRIINVILRYRYLALVLKIMTLAIFAILLWSGMGATSSDSSFLVELRNTNLGNLVVWSLWWPAIVVGAIVLGRVWCMVCPMELITSLCAKIGLKRRPNKFVGSGWIISIFYMIVLLVGIQAFAIHRNPSYMSLYLIAIALVSVVIGLVYKKNTFCKSVCPIGLLLGLYSKLSIFGLRTKEPSTCASCKDKSCIDKRYTYNTITKSCGVGIYPAKNSSNSSCILCGGCVRSCAKYQTKSPSALRPNPTYKRVVFGSELLSGKAIRWSEVAFLVILSGFVISEVWTEWEVTKQILNNISAVFTTPLNIGATHINRVAHGVVIFMILPLVFWSLPYTVAKILGSKLKIKEYLTHYSLSFIPIVAAAHFTKAILKSSSRLGYYKYLPNDIGGMETAQKIIDHKIVIAKLPLEANIAISIVTITAIVAGIWLSTRVIYNLNTTLFTQRANRALYLIPLMYGSIFFVMMLLWRGVSLCMCFML